VNTRRDFLAAGSCALATASAYGAETRQLEVMGNPYTADTYRQLVAAYGHHCNLSFSPREGDETIRSLLLRAFTMRPLPDVAFLNGDVIRILAERGLLVPLDAMLDPGMQPIRIGAAAYGVAFGISMPVVAFNAERARRAGAGAGELPSDWNGILTLARRMQRPDAPGGFIEHDNGGAFTFQYLLESHGGRAMSADELSIAFDSQAGLDALEVLRGFGECGQAATDMSRRQARRAFAGGNIGVMITMSSVVPGLRKSLAVEVIPLPLMNSRARLPIAGPIAVLLRNPHQREAWDFVRFATGHEGQELLARTSGYVRLGESPPRATPWYTFPGRNSLKISELLQNEMQQVATLQKTPAAAMAAMARSVTALLKR
jgi:multiple sugar transport system substrate-binding protein